jgi:hypothetical protein
VCPENENLNGSPPASAGSSTHSDLMNEFKSVYQKSSNKRMDELSPVIDSFPGPTQAGELFSVTSCGWKPPPVSISSRYFLLFVFFFHSSMLPVY